MKHSKLGASSIDRVLKCQYSLVLIERHGEQKTQQSYAIQGHELHQRVEECKSIKEAEKLPKSIRGYAIKCFELQRTCTAWARECFLTHPEHKSIFSTSDFYGYDAKLKRLYVLDLKTGAGIKVHYLNNKQLQMYAYLFILNNPDLEIKSIYLGIYQNTFYDEIMWDKTSLRQLKEGFIKNFKNLLTKLQKGTNLEWKAGEHCRFCPAKRHCKKATEYYNKGLIGLLKKGDNNES